MILGENQLNKYSFGWYNYNICYILEHVLIFCNGLI